MFQFGTRSRERLETCHHDLQVVMRKALDISPFDFAILEGHRTLERQQELYRLGRTTLDGNMKRSLHMESPSLAVDIAPYPFDVEDENIWDAVGKRRFDLLAGVVLAAAKEAAVRLRWGGDWDGDWMFGDQSFHDLPHFELVP